MLISSNTAIDVKADARTRMIEMVGRYLKELAVNELKAHAIPYNGSLFARGEIVMESKIVLGRLFYYYLKQDRRVDLFKEIYRFTVNGWVLIEEWDFSPTEDRFFPSFIVENFQEPARDQWAALPPPRLDPGTDRPVRG